MTGYRGIFKITQNKTPSEDEPVWTGDYKDGFYVFEDRLLPLVPTTQVRRLDKSPGYQNTYNDFDNWCQDYLSSRAAVEGRLIDGHKTRVGCTPLRYYIGPDAPKDLWCSTFHKSSNGNNIVWFLPPECYPTDDIAVGTNLLSVYYISDEAQNVCDTDYINQFIHSLDLYGDKLFQPYKRPNIYQSHLTGVGIDPNDIYLGIGDDCNTIADLQQYVPNTNPERAQLRFRARVFSSYKLKNNLFSPLYSYKYIKGTPNKIDAAVLNYEVLSPGAPTTSFGPYTCKCFILAVKKSIYELPRIII